MNILLSGNLSGQSFRKIFPDKLPGKFIRKIFFAPTILQIYQIKSSAQNCSSLYVHNLRSKYGGGFPEKSGEGGRGRGRILLQMDVHRQERKVYRKADKP